MFFLSSMAFGQDLDFSKIEVVAEKVAGTVYIIRGTDDEKAFSGGNIAVSVGEDGVVMIDSKFGPLSEKILTAIKKIGGDHPKFILNTHVHGDHVGGNAKYHQHGSIIAHENVRKRMDKEPKEKWPVITFDQSLSIHFNGEQIKAKHFPKGHTDGDSIISFTGSNVIHMGDHLFNGMFPFVDLNSGGTVQGYMTNMKKVLDHISDEVFIIPGHGPVCNKKQLAVNYDMLEKTTNLITEKMKAGKSLEELKKEGLPEEWKNWSWAFITTEKWIETVYGSFK